MSTRLRAARTLLVIAVCSLAAACGGSGPLAPNELRQLVAAERRWAARGFGDYAYEVRVLCFCPPEINEWKVVDVRGGRVTAVRDLAGVAIPPERWYGRPTVEELFTRARGPYDEWVASVEMAFDPALGFPTRLAFISKPNIADAGAVYEARNVRPLTAR